jgi:hypothetical protein
VNFESGFLDFSRNSQVRNRLDFRAADPQRAHKQLIEQDLLSGATVVTQTKAALARLEAG